MAGLHPVVRDATGFDDHDAALAINPAGIAPGFNDQTFLNQIQIGLADAGFEFVERRNSFRFHPRFTRIYANVSKKKKTKRTRQRMRRAKASHLIRELRDLSEKNSCNSRNSRIISSA
jgi:hypothetical protein